MCFSLGWVEQLLVWLVIVTLTAGWQKVFAEDPRLGFLSHARLVAKGAGNPGDLLVLADGVTTAADKGKVRKPTTTGTYRLVGVAEEAFVDGQLVRMRPTFGSVTV